MADKDDSKSTGHREYAPFTSPRRKGGTPLLVQVKHCRKIKCHLGSKQRGEFSQGVLGGRSQKMMIGPSTCCFSTTFSATFKVLLTHQHLMVGKLSKRHNAYGRLAANTSEHWKCCRGADNGPLIARPHVLSRWWWNATQRVCVRSCDDEPSESFEHPVRKSRSLYSAKCNVQRKACLLCGAVYQSLDTAKKANNGYVYVSRKG